jgi:hypothetical protein
MGKRLVAGLGTAVSLVLAAGCASPAWSVGASSPAPGRGSGGSPLATTSNAVATSTGPGGCPS